MSRVLIRGGRVLDPSCDRDELSTRAWTACTRSGRSTWCGARSRFPPFLEGRETGRVYLGDGHFCLMFQAPDGQLQIAWVIDKGSFGELRRHGIEGWVDELAGVVSPDLGEHLRANRSRIQQPVPARRDVRSPGRVERAGSAAAGRRLPPHVAGGRPGHQYRAARLTGCGQPPEPIRWRTGAGPDDLDAAARRVRDERLPEVKTIQRLQGVPPRFLFQRTPASRFLVRRVLPILARTGLFRIPFTMAFRRFALGTTPVQLQV